MRAGKKAIGGPHAPAGRTHAVQCVGGDYVRMYYVPACVSLAMCVTATVTMAAMAACSYICSRRLRKAEGANRRPATQTQPLTGAAAGSIHVHTNTSTAATVGIARIGKGAPKKGAGVLTSSHLKREQGTEAAPPRNSIQSNSANAPAPRVSHAFQSRLTPLRWVGISLSLKSAGTPDAASSAARGASASGVASELSELEMRQPEPLRERCKGKRKAG